MLSISYRKHKMTLLPLDYQIVVKNQQRLVLLYERERMNFIPEQEESKKVPYFEDARKEDGWQGHTTTKDVNRLKREIEKALMLLGGIVVGFQQGTFIIDGQERQGFQVHYAVAGMPARMDIAALPVRDYWSSKKKDQSLKMALYMLALGLNGAWLMKQLVPGLNPLIPMMLTEGGKTVSQLWAENSSMKQLMPPPETDFIEAEEV